MDLLIMTQLIIIYMRQIRSMVIQ